MYNHRLPIFETNSSSSHSLSISSDTELKDKLYVTPDGVCNIFAGEFGWGPNKFEDAANKASYLLTFAKMGDVPKELSEKWLLMLEKVILEQTGAKSVVFHQNIKYSDTFPWGYIDHQSSYGDVKEIKPFKSEKEMKQFIFSEDSTLWIDHDNH